MGRKGDQGQMATIVFFAHVDARYLDAFEFYKQDIDALKALGHEVVVCTRYAEIPWNFDAIFVWWWTYALVPVLLCRLLNRPCIITGTFNFRFPADFPGNDYFSRPRWQRFLISRAAKYCSLNLFVSRLELEQCSQQFGLRNARYYPHCLGEDYVLGPADERRVALSNVAWSGRRNLERKGIPDLLRALHLLKGRGCVVETYLAGVEGDGAAHLRELICRNELEEQVHYLGGVSRAEKIRMLRRNELYVQPSRYEGFGLGILEAMGCGACVVVCDVGAVREVVGDCGLYVSPGSPEELALVIERVLNDEALRRELQDRGSTRAKELFGYEKKVERLGGFLRELGIE